jgi:hypothetical protein
LEGFFFWCVPELDFNREQPSVVASKLSKVKKLMASQNLCKKSYNTGLA